MIKIKLMGGLGNQMFQYAYGKHLSLKANTDLILDKSFYNEGNQDPNLMTVRQFDLDVFSNINCKITSDGINCIEGFFQEYNYVTEIRKLLLHDFYLGLPNKLDEIIDKINTTNSICINVRRGDFVSFAQSANFHGFVGNDYLNKAIYEISNKIENPHFFVFSDDIEWCIQNIKIPKYYCHFMTSEYNGYKYSMYLKIMSLCKHFIISNSTYAWWAAWMSNNNNKIIYAPKKWFLNSEEPKGLIPKHWNRL